MTDSRALALAVFSVLLLVVPLVSARSSVIAQAGPFKLLSAGKYTYQQAREECSRHYGFLGVATTRSEYDYVVHLVTQYATQAPYVWVGLRRTGLFQYAISEGPNAGKTYSSDRRFRWGNDIGCAHELCNWDFWCPKIDAERVFINTDTVLMHDGVFNNSFSYHVLCQACVPGTEHCEGGPLQVDQPQVTVTATAGRYKLTSPVRRVTSSMANNLCENLGGWLGNYETDAENNLISELRRSMTHPTILDGYDIDKRGKFIRRFGPQANKVISKGYFYNLGLRCVQQKCWWAHTKPDSLESIIQLEPSGVWNDVSEFLPLVVPHHILCEFPPA